MPFGDEFSAVRIKRDVTTDQGRPLKAGEIGIPLCENEDGTWLIEFEIPGDIFETVTLTREDLEPYEE